MVAKVFFVLCASVLLVESISAQCIGYGNGLGLGLGNLAAANNFGAANGWAAGRLGGCGLSGIASPVASASGGGFTVTSASPIAPTGVSVVSENAIEGAVEVGGGLPVLAGVELEGALPTGGAAGIAYSCGGQVGISSESQAAAGYGTGLANAGLANAGLANTGIACAGLANAGLAGAGLANAGLTNAGLANAGLANAGLANAGLANVGLANAGLANAGLAGVGLGANRLARPCGCSC